MNYNVNLKKKLRQNLIAKRKQLTTQEVKSLSKKIFDNINDIFGIEFFKKFNFIAGYIPFNNEVDIISIINWLHINGVKFTLPKIHTDGMKFYEWNENYPLVKNSFNIYEPTTGTEVRPNVFLIPVVGFDKKLNRLGHGYGYYDKSLRNIYRPIKIGIGYNFQEVERIPIEEHDIKLDYVVTDKVCY